MTTWRDLGVVDGARLAAARLQAHHATQWLARAARAHIMAWPDDGHTNLGWDDAFGGFISHPHPDGARLGLRIGDLTLALLGADGGRPLEVLALGGRRDAEAREWLGRNARARGLDPHALDTPLPYALPGRPAEIYEVDAEALGALATWFSNADVMLGAAREHVVARGIVAPPVCCWPHHFDLDTLVTVAPGRTAGIGFAPGDDYYGEPYFYVSAYPAPDVARLPTLPPIGHWHTKNFTAAVAPAREIFGAADQGGAVQAFLRAAVDAMIKALGSSGGQGEAQPSVPNVD
jgi:hypothetical protein